MSANTIVTVSEPKPKPSTLDPSLTVSALYGTMDKNNNDNSDNNNSHEINSEPDGPRLPPPEDDSPREITHYTDQLAQLDMSKESEWVELADKIQFILMDMQSQWRTLDKKRKALLKSAKLHNAAVASGAPTTQNNTNNESLDSALSDSADNWKSSADGTKGRGRTNIMNSAKKTTAQQQNNTETNSDRDFDDDSSNTGPKTTRSSNRTNLKRSGAQSDSDSAFFSTGGSSSESRSGQPRSVSKRSKRKLN